jgi:hypothetical protein
MEIHTAEPLVQKPSALEIEIVIGKFKKAQLIQAGGESLRSEIHKLINSVWKKELQNYHIKVVNISFQNVAQLKYLAMTVINQNLIHEKIKRRLNSGNACYHSVQNLLSSPLLSK